jgi:uncharacterized protein YkwD
MANKVLILVLGAVVVTSLVVGGLLGMQFAGDGGDVVPEETATPAVEATATTTAPPTSTPTASTPSEGSGTATTAEPTATPEPTPTFSPADVNATAVEHHLRVGINEEVRAGADPLRNEATLDEMAQFHTDNMLAQGYPAHAAGGYSTKARYEKFDRYAHCRVPNDNNAGIRDGEELEVIGRISLNTSADLNETRIAERLLDDWADDETAMERLGLRNADRAGVGIAVSSDARVYATVDLC